MLQVRYQPYTLRFKRPSQTSREVLTTKDTYFIVMRNAQDSGVAGIGECGLLKGLSYDDRVGYEEKLQQVCHQLSQISLQNVEAFCLSLVDWPSIRFGVEMAALDLKLGGSRHFYQTDFIEGHPIAINGLVWMGTADFMREQIMAKLAAGFSCIKLKIGTIDFAAELELLANIRQAFDANQIEIRVDANGAFTAAEALAKLNCLSAYDLHSIEQPIAAGEWAAMADLCKKTPIPIALDEELIGVNNPTQKQALLDVIKPQYIILKPSLIGGFTATQDWINYAGQRRIPWWITSALESNIGLNAIAQFASATGNTMPQGLGTGQLYTNNITAPLAVKSGQLYYYKDRAWDLSPLHLKDERVG